MRRSNRERIVTGALELIGAEGIDALTFEAVAERVGLSRGGVVYHFPTREALIEGIAQDLLSRWTEDALALLGKPLEDSTRSEQLVAMTRSVLEGTILPGELAFMISGRPEAAGLTAAWNAFYAEWVGDIDTLSPLQQVALLAVDGYWSNVASGAADHNPSEERVLGLIAALAAGEEPGGRS